MDCWSGFYRVKKSNFKANLHTEQILAQDCSLNRKFRFGYDYFTKKVLLWELVRYRSYDEKQKRCQTSKGHNFSRKKGKNTKKIYLLSFHSFKLWGLRGTVALAFRFFNVNWDSQRGCGFESRLCQKIGVVLFHIPRCIRDKTLGALCFLMFRDIPKK